MKSVDKLARMFISNTQNRNSDNREHILEKHFLIVPNDLPLMLNDNHPLRAGGYLYSEKALLICSISDVCIINLLSVLIAFSTAPGIANTEISFFALVTPV